jgi:hypothetical protein
MNLSEEPYSYVIDALDKQKKEKDCRAHHSFYPR